MATIYDVLKSEHRMISELLEQIETAANSNPDEISSIFENLKTELVSHTRAEEEVFYQPLKLLGDTDIEWEGEQEHHVLCLLLDELSRLPFKSETWLAKCKVLADLVSNHVAQEEGNIFADARKVFTTEEVEEMAEDFFALKDIYRTIVDDSLMEDTEIFRMPSNDRKIRRRQAKDDLI